ncbi:MAG: Gfo/Idh/MocA family oxidoreductase [Abditibacteriales bacterium]|nr:Gfo/Idh/MocA family oxidoreductase [Abditibacteriales bacterium]
MFDEKRISDLTLSRREFLKTSAAATAGTLAAQMPHVHAAGSDVIRVGLIGCGGRGTGALHDIVNAAPNIEIVALGDLFQEKVDRCFNLMSAAAQSGDGSRGRRRAADPSKLSAAWKVTRERCFSGFDNYLKVIHSGVDLVILATPPGFRPTHFKAAIEAGKHVFMEKPIATCPTGVRMVIEASKLAKQKGLGVVAGTLYRHTPSYIETVKRIHAGDIGEIVAAQCYYNTSGIWNRERELKPEWSEIEKQCWNWYHYVWLSGDHIVEQHVHNLDVINWCFSRDGLAHPVKCVGVGGRTVRYTPGNIWDHFAIEYEYPNGARVLSLCRHWEGCPGRVSDHIVGTKGVADPSSRIMKHTGETVFRYGGPPGNGYVLEHTHLIESIRSGNPLNEGEQIAYSTMMAIMGRLAAYTGKEVTWDFVMKQSQLNYVKEDPKPGPCPVEPPPVPGKTPLV